MTRRGYRNYSASIVIIHRLSLRTLIKQQDFKHLGDDGWEEAQVQQHEQALRTTKILELYTIIPQRAIDAWTFLGTIPASYMENPTDNRHGYYNFHTEMQYAINDFIHWYV
eukprot:6482119-Amphidinium_carterae.2